MKPVLGKLERVELNDIWKTEAGDFTPWLAEEGSLELLGKTIGLELELEATEKYVGPFRADILCKNMDDDSWVVIENQLARTDHKHLGQIFTYAAGLDAVTMVWIASRFTDEHRAALDWLNKITDEAFRFFGLEVEAWQIGDSIPAPKFNIISQPNDLSKFVSHGAQKLIDGTTSEAQSLYYRYWENFAEYLENTNSKLRPPKPTTRGGHRFIRIINRVSIAVTINLREQKIIVEILLETNDIIFNKALFDFLLEDHEAIEREIGFELVWEKIITQQRSKMCLYKPISDLNDETDWSNQYEWLERMVLKFDEVFRERVIGFNPPAPK